MGEDDAPELHAEDTLRAGRGLCRPSAVAALTEEAPARIRDLVELGVEFDDGLGLEGGHLGGASSTRAAPRPATASPGRSPSACSSTRGSGSPRARGCSRSTRPTAACVGVVTDRRRDRRARDAARDRRRGGALGADDEPRGATGEGMAAAYRAGAALADLEFVQFHPTTLVDSSLLLSEALRGEGAVLLDEWGQRFTDELAPRDVVAREIAARGTALLDLRAIDRGRFPSLMDTLEERATTRREEPIPVAPAAHYTVGGVVTDLDGRTELPRPVRGRRVRRHRRPRREPAGLELAARVPRLRPPRRARRARPSPGLAHAELESGPRRALPSP